MTYMRAWMSLKFGQIRQLVSMATDRVIMELEKVSMGHGCPRLLFLFQLQLNIGYTISEQDTIYILQTQFIATLLSSLKTTKFKLRKSYKN